ncbi:MAP kinase kinase [Pelomyxa schiedti]|nr:MAP kinase kinase [Pelomyxa schiedti]
MKKQGIGDQQDQQRGQDTHEHDHEAPGANANNNSNNKGTNTNNNNNPRHEHYDDDESSIEAELATLRQKKQMVLLGRLAPRGDDTESSSASDDWGGDGDPEGEGEGDGDGDEEEDGDETQRTDDGAAADGSTNYGEDEEGGGGGGGGGGRGARPRRADNADTNGKNPRQQHQQQQQQQQQGVRLPKLKLPGAKRNGNAEAQQRAGSRASVDGKKNLNWAKAEIETIRANRARIAQVLQQQQQNHIQQQQQDQQRQQQIPQTSQILGQITSASVPGDRAVEILAQELDRERAKNSTLVEENARLQSVASELLVLLGTASDALNVIHDVENAQLFDDDSDNGKPSDVKRRERMLSKKLLQVQAENTALRNELATTKARANELSTLLVKGGIRPHSPRHHHTDQQLVISPPVLQQQQPPVIYQQPNTSAMEQMSAAAAAAAAAAATAATNAVVTAVTETTRFQVQTSVLLGLQTEPARGAHGGRSDGAAEPELDPDCAQGEFPAAAVHGVAVGFGDDVRTIRGLFGPQSQRHDVAVGPGGVSHNSERVVVHSQIGDVTVGEVIGRGATAVVHKGLVSTGQVVAIKVVNSSVVSSAAFQSITEEIDMLIKLNHKNIISVLGYSLMNKFLYIFLEYGEGGSLSHTIKEFGPLQETLAVMYIEQVLKALVYLHSKEVIHRDLKAANILMTKIGTVKLCDFGVSADLHDSSKQFSVVGSPYWIAPEIIQISGHCPESDIWSLGCTIVELLTGNPPFYNLNAMAAMFKIVNDDMPIPPNCSPEMTDVLQKCFKKEPSERPSAQELLNHPLFQKAHSNASANTDEIQRLAVYSRSASSTALLPSQSGLAAEAAKPIQVVSATKELTEMRQLHDDYSRIQEEIEELTSKNTQLKKLNEETERQIEARNKEYKFLLTHTMDVIKVHAIGSQQELAQKIAIFERETGIALVPQEEPKHTHHHAHHHRHRHRHSDTSLSSSSPVQQTLNNTVITTLNSGAQILHTSDSNASPPVTSTSAPLTAPPSPPALAPKSPPLIAANGAAMGTPENRKILTESGTMSLDQKKKKAGFFGKHFRRKSDEE